MHDGAGRGTKERERLLPASAAYIRKKFKGAFQDTRISSIVIGGSEAERFESDLLSGFNQSAAQLSKQ